MTVPISFLAAMQIGLFRNIGDLAYLPVATTGNLMRFVEAGYDGFVEKNAGSRRAFGVYGALILAFASGALMRRDRQQGVGSARDLAARRVPCGHALSVHHR